MICCDVQNPAAVCLCASLLRRNTPRFNYPLKAEEFITAKFIIATVIKSLIEKARGEGQNPSEGEVQCSQQNYPTKLYPL